MNAIIVKECVNRFQFVSCLIFFFLLFVLFSIEAIVRYSAKKFTFHERFWTVKGCFCKLCLPLEIVLYVNGPNFCERKSTTPKKWTEISDENRICDGLRPKNWYVIFFLEIQVISSDWNWVNQFYFCEILLRIYSLRHIIVQSNDEKISIMLISQRSSVLEFFLVWYINKRIAVCLKATKFQQKMNLLCAVLNNVLKRGSWHAICVNFFLLSGRNPVFIQCWIFLFCENGSLAKIPHTQKLCQRKSVKND